MSDTHPYWAYIAVPGTIGAEHEERALSEGRRAFALHEAAELYGTDEEILARARKFEAYLKGEAVADVNGAPLDGS